MALGLSVKKCLLCQHNDLRPVFRTHSFCLGCLEQYCNVIDTDLFTDEQLKHTTSQIDPFSGAEVLFEEYKTLQNCITAMKLRVNETKQKFKQLLDRASNHNTGNYELISLKLAADEQVDLLAHLLICHVIRGEVSGMVYLAYHFSQLYCPHA